MIQSPSAVKPIQMKDPAFPLSVEKYHEMIRAGILTENDPVELLEGGLVFHMPKNPPHKVTKRKLITVFDRLLPPGWFFQPKDPITLSDGEPEPDGAVLRGNIDDYGDRHACPAETGIVLEVSDSTLSIDRGTKLRSYARAGIATYWIINLVERQIEMYTNPLDAVAEPDYATRTDFAEAESVPVMLDGVTIGTVAVADVLP